MSRDPARCGCTRIDGQTGCCDMCLIARLADAVGPRKATELLDAIRAG
jgi:hypothetical protein